MKYRFAWMPLVLLCAAPLAEAQTIGATPGAWHELGLVSHSDTKQDYLDLQQDMFKTYCRNDLHRQARETGEGTSYCGIGKVHSTVLHDPFNFAAHRIRFRGVSMIDFSCSARMSVICQASEQTTVPVDNPVAPICEWPERCSPIVIDMDRDGFEFTDRVGGVVFDINADGAPDSTSWTAARADDAFLVLDRNGNGVIDDGSELFGNVTPQPPASQPNGYEALAVFDENGDGAISAADPIFDQLRLWLDRSHDGMSQPQELSSLSSTGIEAISLDYRESRRQDAHGNLLRYWSRVDVSGQRRPLRSVDVFFLAD